MAIRFCDVAPYLSQEAWDALATRHGIDVALEVTLSPLVPRSTLLGLTQHPDPEVALTATLRTLEGPTTYKTLWSWIKRDRHLWSLAVKEPYAVSESIWPLMTDDVLLALTRIYVKESETKGKLHAEIERRGVIGLLGG